MWFMRTLSKNSSNACAATCRGQEGQRAMDNGPGTSGQCGQWTADSVDIRHGTNVNRFNLSSAPKTCDDIRDETRQVELRRSCLRDTATFPSHCAILVWLFACCCCCFLAWTHVHQLRAAAGYRPVAFWTCRHAKAMPKFSSRAAIDMARGTAAHMCECVCTICVCLWVFIA